MFVLYYRKRSNNIGEPFKVMRNFMDRNID